jgi:hypothetical protein
VDILGYWILQKYTPAFLLSITDLPDFFRTNTKRFHFTTDRGFLEENSIPAFPIVHLYNLARVAGTLFAVILSDEYPVPA